jgi:prophage antirepressor-like protein
MSEATQGEGEAVASLPTEFLFDQSPVRAIVQDGEPWFVAKDVCDILDIDNPSQAVGRIDDDERGTTTVRTPGGPQEVLTVNESGVYALIFTSRKPEAKRFRKWVTSEVLPAIRRTGRYETSDPRFPRQDASTVERQRKLLEQALADATLVDHRLQVAIAHWLHQIHVDPNYGPTRDEYTFVKFVNALREANVLAGLLLDYPRRPTHELSDADRPESPRNIQ